MMRSRSMLMERGGALLVLGGLYSALVAAGRLPVHALAVGAALFAGLVVLIGPAMRSSLDRFGWANRVTLFRAVVVLLLCGALIRPELFSGRFWLVPGLAGLALALDGLDGWLARRLRATSAFGARFDMETDAALMLVLCLGLWLGGQAGVWVLAIGCLRYAFVLATLIRPWLAAPLPPSFRRKLICVWQVVALIGVLLPPLPSAWTTPVLISALAALSYSFIVDITWLYRSHRAGQSRHWSPV